VEDRWNSQTCSVSTGYGKVPNVVSIIMAGKFTCCVKLKQDRRDTGEVNHLSVVLSRSMLKSLAMMNSSGL